MRRDDTFGQRNKAKKKCEKGELAQPEKGCK